MGAKHAKQDWINGTTQGSENSLVSAGKLDFQFVSLTGMENCFMKIAYEIKIIKFKTPVYI